MSNILVPPLHHLLYREVADHNVVLKRLCCRVAAEGGCVCRVWWQGSDVVELPAAQLGKEAGCGDTPYGVVAEAAWVVEHKVLECLWTVEWLGVGVGGWLGE